MQELHLEEVGLVIDLLIKKKLLVISSLHYTHLIPRLSTYPTIWNTSNLQAFVLSSSLKKTQCQDRRHYWHRLQQLTWLSRLNNTQTFSWSHVSICLSAGIESIGERGGGTGMWLDEPYCWTWATYLCVVKTASIGGWQRGWPESQSWSPAFHLPRKVDLQQLFKMTLNSVILSCDEAQPV